MRSYRPEELFDEQGALVPELAALPPKAYRRMSANPVANGGELLRDLVLPDFRDYAVDVPRPGATTSEAARVLGTYVRDVMDRNRENFRMFGPDETRLEPPGRGVRGDGSPVRWRRSSTRTSSRRRTAG